MRIRRVHRPAPTMTGLVYLVVSTNDPIGFPYAPSFQFTLPARTTVASGSFAYIMYWDPYMSGSAGWTTLLGPGIVSG